MCIPLLVCAACVVLDASQKVVEPIAGRSCAIGVWVVYYSRFAMRTGAHTRVQSFKDFPLERRS